MSPLIECLPRSLAPAPGPGNVGASVVKRQGRFNRFAEFQSLGTTARSTHGNEVVTTLSCQGSSAASRLAPRPGPSGRATKAEVEVPGPRQREPRAPSAQLPRDSRARPRGNQPCLAGRGR
jgi:hypothetical protein